MYFDTNYFGGSAVDRGKSYVFVEVDWPGESTAKCLTRVEARLGTLSDGATDPVTEPATEPAIDDAIDLCEKADGLACRSSADLELFRFIVDATGACVVSWSIEPKLGLNYVVGGLPPIGIVPLNAVVCASLPPSELCVDWPLIELGTSEFALSLSYLFKY